MNAMALQTYGGPEALGPVELPEPKVAPGEVLIRVKAAGVNPVDWKLAAGNLDPLMVTHFPLVPGWDVAGVVERVGLDVPEFRAGDEVVAYVRKDQVEHGTYAELVSANVRMVARKAESLSWEQAAGLPLAGLTAQRSLRRAGVPGPGEPAATVLIHAASGGVGALAAQLAVASGARVIGTASERNHEFLRGLGVEPVVYGEGLAERVRALAPDGVDAALDFAGAGAAEASLPLLRSGPGRLVSIVDPGVTELGGEYVWVRPDAEGLAELGRLADAGRLTVPVGGTFPLAEAAEAWRVSQEGHVRGKLVLTVS
ncbi:NADP-dependent oxidoreductase [Streptomyces aidingensis]|uniref:NADPH:quinone reductase n=1 Tax=Streptomyces aidingensis TaxID=910347 RepID=A0A1I1QPT8_9ACTN|nr:NADP-dependent oxidoreductase [Streptomyces aidingensis]SFD24136.1 NADPH:quinone reductase [Streptomyces aidingensis]